MSRLRVVAIAFRCLGAIIVFVALLHLYATVLIRDGVLAHISDPALREFISPGYLLDHVIVGLYMLPMGFVMIWSSGGLSSGERWAYVVNWSFSLALLVSPVAIAIVMPKSSFHSPAFALAAGLMLVAGIMPSAMLLWARREFASRVTET
jgi:hypothetical protein